MTINRLLIWLLISAEGLVLLFGVDQRAKYNTTVTYFLQFQDQLLQTVANDIRYLIAFFSLLPLIAGDFFVIKFFAVVAYCMNVVIVQNLYIRVDGLWEQLKMEEWLQCLIKLFILFLAFEALIMSILEEQQTKKLQRNRKNCIQKAQNKRVNQASQKTKAQEA